MGKRGKHRRRSPFGFVLLGASSIVDLSGVATFDLMRSSMPSANRARPATATVWANAAVEDARRIALAGSARDRRSSV